MNSTVYLVLAYLGAAVLYGGYRLWLAGQERRFGKRDRDVAR
ncbi:MAG TPA: hypothetical protein VE669_02455 [Actinomycetota bacterium]|nr:hypothetical protein [Actinomycetota bacterium]